MSTVLRPVDAEFVLSRVAETPYNKALRPDAYNVVESAATATLSMFADAGIVTAVRVDGEHREQAVAQVFAALDRYRATNPERLRALRDELPELADALDALVLEA